MYVKYIGSLIQLHTRSNCPIMKDDFYCIYFCGIQKSGNGLSFKTIFCKRKSPAARGAAKERKRDRRHLYPPLPRRLPISPVAGEEGESKKG